MPRLFPFTRSLLAVPTSHHVLERAFLPSISIITKAPRHFFSTSNQQRVHHYTKTKTHDQDNYYYYEQVTESTVLGSFPRPNLNPTLHYTLFTTASVEPPSANDKNKKKKAKKCVYCLGPHTSENCPC
ncbi:uncharacterized protein BX664DRAFT_329176 [Halteromyces radiatus]|uniref:uncharacterized protein n=1 Tax=Halteromyces radiatus TaxID=101107 RepID=UPI00221FE910|nr:uncharacterized protein BX664DRAFT_329176 [Halteromyces radiatus]KAI8093211.1 hypothetical protein BX664DRAFT_329176 [Halteromyces radiatus]